MWRKAQDVVNNACSLWGREICRNQGATTIYIRLNKQLFQRDTLAASSQLLNTWREREVTMPAEEEMKMDPFRSAVKISYILELPIAVSIEESTGKKGMESAKEKLRRILASMIALLDFILKIICAEGGTSVRSKTIEITKNVRWDTAKILFVVDDGAIFDGKRFVSGFTKSAQEFVALRAMIAELDDMNPSSNTADSNQESTEIDIGPGGRVCQHTEAGQIESRNVSVAQGSCKLRKRRSVKDEEEESIEPRPNLSRSLNAAGRMTLMVFSIK